MSNGYPNEHPMCHVVRGELGAINTDLVCARPDKAAVKWTICVRSVSRHRSPSHTDYDIRDLHRLAGEKSGEPYSGKLSVKSDLSPVFGKFEHHPASFNMGYLVTPYPYPNGGAHPLPVSMVSSCYI
ncbi:Protein pangolin, isoforms A/H/I [Papilio machaon]|uniref:Protein pangolin, isoforms A/H/I n=1 Tax=Papilio machaon TaxID=76193 RepID=A0A0N1II95_PAPMA|nr:Protein pangolin, isoforms A/H/I [Papilio machaon]